MTVSKITAVQTFSHGRLNMRPGQVETIESDEARELCKAGLVTIGEDQDEDLIGGEKMAPITSNKMEKATSNKSAK